MLVVAHGEPGGQLGCCAAQVMAAMPIISVHNGARNLADFSLIIPFLRN